VQLSSGIRIDFPNAPEEQHAKARAIWNSEKKILPILIILLFDEAVGIFKWLVLDGSVKRHLLGTFIFEDAIFVDSTPRSLCLLRQKT
jgi:hypothetical protein